MDASDRPSPSTDPVADAAFVWCERFVEAHARRDPLATALRVQTLRRPLMAIYAFARTADDLAGGPGTAAARAAALADLHDRLEAAFHGRADGPLFIALQCVAREHGVPITPLAELLTGLRAEIAPAQPVTFEALARRYASSVGPIARVLLHVAGETRPATVALAERFAVGLRLLDDLADLRTDLRSGRCTVPSEDLLAFDLDPQRLLAGDRPQESAELLRFCAARVRTYLVCGHALHRRAPASLRLFVETLTRWGLRAIDRVESGAFDPLAVADEPPAS